MAGPKTRQKLSQIGDPNNPRNIRASFNAQRFNPSPPDEMYQNQRQDGVANYNVGSNYTLNPPLSDNSGLMLARANNPNVNQMKNNYFSNITNSPWFGIGGYDFVENRDPTPENLAFFQDIKDEDAWARDTNYQVTLPEHEKLGKLSGYGLLPEGVYPYVNPSWIENNPSFGLDYMMDILGGKGKVGFRKNLNDDEWNAYAGLRFNI